MVMKFHPNITRTHHRVVRSLQVDKEAINRAFKVQLFYVRLLRLECQRVLSAKEIVDIEVGGREIGQVGVPEIYSGEAGPSGFHRQSFRLTEERFRKGRRPWLERA